MDLLGKLQSLVEQKDQLMQQVLSVSQGLVNTGENLEKMQVLLDARQQYMKKIDQLDEQIEVVEQGVLAALGVDNWQVVAKNHPQTVAKIDATVANIKKTASAAHKITQQSRQQAESQLTQLQQEFKKIQSKKTGFIAYRQKDAQASGYFLDKKK